MSPLFETLRVLNGQVQLLDYHNLRCNRSRKVLFNATETIDLGNYISVPAYYATGQAKCKVVYQNDVKEVSFQHYKIRNITSIKIVEGNDIEYAHKFQDRSALSNLYAQRDSCDEIVIVKNDLITDCFYYNIAFWDGFEWKTPKDCFLPGVMRSVLLINNKISESSVYLDDLKNFSKVCLFNALTPFGEIELDSSNIIS